MLIVTLILYNLIATKHIVWGVYTTLLKSKKHAYKCWNIEILMKWTFYSSTLELQMDEKPRRQAYSNLTLFCWLDFMIRSSPCVLYFSYLLNMLGKVTSLPSRSKWSRIYTFLDKRNATSRSLRKIIEYQIVVLKKGLSL